MSLRPLLYSIIISNKLLEDFNVTVLFLSKKKKKKLKFRANKQETFQQVHLQNYLYSSLIKQYIINIDMIAAHAEFKFNFKLRDINYLSPDTN